MAIHASLSHTSAQLLDDTIAISFVALCARIRAHQQIHATPPISSHTRMHAHAHTVDVRV